MDTNNHHCCLEKRKKNERQTSTHPLKLASEKLQSKVVKVGSSLTSLFFLKTKSLVLRVRL